MKFNFGFHRMNKKQPITKFLLASGIIVLGTFFLAPYVIPINGLHKEPALLKKWISDKFTPNNLQYHVLNVKVRTGIFLKNKSIFNWVT